jgi:hypothetical protein
MLKTIDNQSFTKQTVQDEIDGQGHFNEALKSFLLAAGLPDLPRRD